MACSITARVEMSLLHSEKYPYRTGLQIIDEQDPHNSYTGQGKLKIPATFGKGEKGLKTGYLKKRRNNFI